MTQSAARSLEAPSRTKGARKQRCKRRREAQATHKPATAGGYQSGQSYEGRRQALRDLGASGSKSTEQLDRVLSMARSYFRAEYAALVLTDGQNATYTSKAGFRGSPEVRGLLSMIIDSGRPVMIGSTHRTASAKFTVRVGGTRMEFCAGYPIEAPDGSRVGALFVFGQSPRKTKASDLAMKRDLAMFLQRELWTGSKPENA